MLKSITLTNFRSYGHETVEFGPGISTLEAPSGVGKSNLLMAIGTLFGATYLGCELVRRGHKSGVVEAAWGNFRIRQSFGNGATAAVYTLETRSTRNYLEAEGKTEVAGYLADALESPNLKKLWHNVIYVEQFAIRDGFMESPSKRKAHFDAVLGVDQYEQAWADLRDPASLMKSRLDLATQKRDMLSRQVEGRAELEQELSDLGGQYATLRNEQDDLSAIHTLLRAEVDRLATQADVLRDQIKVAKASRVDALDLKSYLDNATFQRQAAQEWLDRAIGEISALQPAREWLDENEDVSERYRAALDERVEAIDAIHADMVSTGERCRLLQEAVKILRSGTCPVCLRPVEDNGILEKYEADLAAANLALRKLDQEEARIERDMKPGLEELAALHNDWRDKQVAVGRLSGLQKDQAEAEEKIALLSAKIAGLEADLAAVGPTAYEDLENALAALKENEKREKLHRLNTEIALNEEKLKNLKERRQGVRMRLAAAAEMEAEIAELEKKITALSGGLEKIGRVRDAYRKAAPVLASRVIGLVSHEANKIFSEVWAHRQGRLEWRPDYSVSVQFDGVDHGFDVSGGQQVSAALALRLGLLSVLSPVKLLVLDEATMGALDRETAEIVPELVKRIVERGFQVIAVDHSGLFDNVAVHRIEIENVDGESRVV